MWAALAVLLPLACVDTGVFECRTDLQCRDGSTPGFCEAEGRCSFPAASCESGRRHADDNTCVDSCLHGIVAGDSHTCTWRGTGTAACWGGNEEGQLGDGTLLDRSVPALVASLDGVAEIAAGEDHSCARRADGSVACWGSTYDGQLGLGALGDDDFYPRTTPVPVRGAPSAAQIVAGGAHTCVLTNGGAVWCWGSSEDGQAGAMLESVRFTPAEVRFPEGTPRIARLAAGGAHTCAVARDGTVWCWGNDDVGQLGDGGDDPTPSPRRVEGIADAIDVVSGDGHACALDRRGNVSCWGANDDQQLGAGDPSMPSPGPLPVAGISGVWRIAAGGSTTCAIDDDGALSCWGRNAEGQLGDGTTLGRAEPRPVPGLGEVAWVGAGRAHVCALTYDEGIHCWGDARTGRLGVGTELDRLAPVLVDDLAGSDAIALGRSHGCALDAGGVRCWGDNQLGQIGDGSESTRLAPHELVGLAADDLVAGRAHSCARAGSELRCWGSNLSGQISPTAEIEIAATTPVRVMEVEPITSVAAGVAHTCAISMGTVRCWGDDDWLQLGEGGGAESVAGATLLAAGGRHTCASSGSETRCWGDDSSGQLGDGGNEELTDAAVLVPLPRAPRVVVQLAAGDAHSCARMDDGAVWCWGADGTIAGETLVPHAMVGLPASERIAAGERHTCALGTDGMVRCWGAGEHGQLGDGERLARTAPVVVSLPGPAAAIAAGANSTCARLDDDSVHCWGAAGDGQLALGEPAPVVDAASVDFDCF